MERDSRNTGEANLDLPAPAEPPPDSSDLFVLGWLVNAAATHGAVNHSLLRFAPPGT